MNEGRTLGPLHEFEGCHNIKGPVSCKSKNIFYGMIETTNCTTMVDLIYFFSLHEKKKNTHTQKLKDIHPQLASSTLIRLNFSNILQNGWISTLLKVDQNVNQTD